MEHGLNLICWFLRYRHIRLSTLFATSNNKFPWGPFTFDNLEDVKELDDDEEMLSPEDIDLNAEPEPRQRNEDIQEGMYFKTTTLMCFLC
jgi:hypothetical protein